MALARHLANRSVGARILKGRDSLTTAPDDQVVGVGGPKP